MRLLRPDFGAWSTPLLIIDERLHLRTGLRSTADRQLALVPLLARLLSPIQTWLPGVRRV